MRYASRDYNNCDFNVERENHVENNDVSTRYHKTNKIKKRKVKRCLKVIKISLSKNNKHFLESCRKLMHFDTMLDKNTIHDIKPLNKRYLRCF